MQSFIIAGKHAWKVLGKTTRSQAAEMVIAPGDSEGSPTNRHPKSDQWLYVRSGSGVAFVEGRKIPLKPGSLLLIEKGERHQIIASAKTSLKTINFYSPPAY